MLKGIGREIGRRTLAFVLALLMLPVTGLFSQRASAAAKAENGEQSAGLGVPAAAAGLGMTALADYYGYEYMEGSTYIMLVSTGSLNGTNIAYFTIEYIDTDGNDRTEVIFPQTAYEVSYDYCMDMGYQVEFYQRLNNAEQLGFDLDDWKVNNKALSTNSTDSYILRFQHDVDRFTALGIHANANTDWTVTGLEIYRPMGISGYAMYGYISTDRYLKFVGDKVLELPIEDEEGLTLNFDTPGAVIYFGNPHQTEKQAEANRLLYYPENYRKKSSNYINGKIEYVQFPSEAAYMSAVHYDSHGSEFLFQLDLSEIAGSGMETFNILYGQTALVSPGGERDFTECLAVTMRYMDTRGNYRQVFLPITISMLAWAARGRDILSHMKYFGQAGQSLQFVGCFPELDHVVEWYICYGTEFVESAAQNRGVGKRSPVTDAVTSFQSNATMATRARCLSGTSDSIRIAGLSLYKVNEQSSITVSIDDTIEVENRDIELISYYVSSDPEGVLLQSDNYVDIYGTEVQQYDGGAYPNLEPDTWRDYYLVSLQTDNLEQAGTVNRATVSFNYLDENGLECTTEDIDLQQAAQDMYGYWPTYSEGAGGNQYLTASERLKDGMDTGISSHCDGAYRYYMNPGRALQFLVAMPGAETFTGMTMNLEEGAGDEYQLSCVEISKPVDMGDLNLIMSQFAIGEGSDISQYDRVWQREGMISNLMTHYEPDGAILVLPSQKVKIDFSDQTGNNTEVEDTDVNEAIDKTKVTYQEALRNYRVTKSRIAYTVSVQVANDALTSIADGDTGSTNQFFFQLEFEKNGKTYKSAFVNANQQLEGDSFRSNQKASFNIYMNGDYGDLKAVNILPDDISSSGDTFDKLKISEITVQKLTNSGINVAYVISDVGWIDIPYNDEEADYIGTRTADELIRTFTVSETRMTTDLEFTIVNSAKTDIYSGNYKATIYYKDTNNATQHVDIDLVEYLQNYVTPGKKTEVTTGAYLTSNSNYMFVPNRTNRFTVSFMNISSLVSITMSSKTLDNSVVGDWGVQNVSVRQVSGVGTLRLTSAEGSYVGNYQRDYGVGNSLNLCTARESDLPRTISAGSSSFSSMSIRFTDNQIEKLDPDTGGIVIDAPTPVSQNDQLRLTLVPKSTTGLHEGDRVTATLNYQDVYGDSRRIENMTLVYRQQYLNFVCDGTISAPLFCIPTSVTLTSENDVQLSNISVKQVRDNLVLREFSQFGMKNGAALKANTSSVFGLSAEDEEADFSDKYSQMLYLGFAADSRTSEINAEKDVLVSLRYLYKGDAEKLQYTTSVISLSSRNITKIGPNTVIAVPFEADMLERVDKVVVSVTDSSMVLRVDRVAVRQNIRSGTDNTSRIDGWFTCALDQSVQLTEKNTYFQTSDTSAALGLSNAERLCPVELNFVTADDEGSNSSGASGTVGLTLWYLNNIGEIRTCELDDVESALVSGDFQTKAAEGTGEGKLIMLVPGAKKILAVVLSISDDDDTSTATWKLKKLTMTAQLGLGDAAADQNITKPLDQWVRELNGVTVDSSAGDLEINISDLVIDASLNWPGCPSPVIFNNLDTTPVITAADVTDAFSLTIENAALAEMNWIFEKAKLINEAAAPAERITTPESFSLENNSTYLLTAHLEGLSSLSAGIEVTVAAPAA